MDFRHGWRRRTGGCFRYRLRTFRQTWSCPGRKRHLHVHRGRREGRAGVQQPPHHHLHQGRPVLREHQSRKKEDEPHVHRGRQKPNDHSRIAKRLRQLHHLPYRHLRGDGDGVYNEGHHDTELGRAGEAPGGGAARGGRPRGGLPLQRHRLPGHSVRALAAAVLPGMRHLRHRRLHLRQRGGGAAELQPVGTEADGHAEEHHHGAEPQGPQPEHRNLHPRVPGGGGRGPGAGEGQLLHLPRPAVEAVLQGGVHDVVHGGSHPPSWVAGVERHLRTGHALLRGVHELRTGGCGGEAGDMARVPGDHAAGGGEQVHGGAVHLRLLMAAFDRSGLLVWLIRVNGHPSLLLNVIIPFVLYVTSLFVHDIGLFCLFIFFLRCFYWNSSERE
ncbi:unnamed protein product [Musa textilis]